MTQRRNEASRAVVRSLHEFSAAELSAAIDELTRQAAAVLEHDGTDPGGWTRRCEADLRFSGQREPLTIALPEESLDAPDIIEQVERLLDAEHERLYTFTLDADLELVTLRVVVESVLSRVEVPSLSDAGADPKAAVVGLTQTWLDGGWRNASVYDRAKLSAGNRIIGPAIITEMDSTTLVLPAHTATIDYRANIVIRPSEDDHPVADPS
jgi:N-methylhydantoinase A